MNMVKMMSLAFGLLEVSGLLEVNNCYLVEVFTYKLCYNNKSYT